MMKNKLRLWILPLILTQAFNIGQASGQASAADTKTDSVNDLKFPIHSAIPENRAPHEKRNKSGAEIDSADFGDVDTKEKSSMRRIVEELGMGYNSITQEELSDCVHGVADGPSPTFNAEYTLDLIQSSEQLKEDMSAEASGSTEMFGWTATASAKYDRSVATNSNNDYLLVKVRVTGAPEVVLSNPTLKFPKPDADAASRQKFFDECGDSFVTGANLGAEFVTMLTLNKSDAATNTDVEAKVGINGPTTSVNASMLDKLASSSSHMSLFVKSTKMGGPGDMPADTVPAILDYATHFAKSITSSNAVYLGNVYESYRRFGVRDMQGMKSAKSVMEQLRTGMKDRSKSVSLLGAALAERRRLRVPEGGVQAMINSLNNDLRIMDSIIDRCGNHPDSQRGECDIPPQYATFTPPPNRMPLYYDLPVTSDAIVSWRVQEQGRTVMLTGHICFDGQDLCYANGTSDRPDAYVLVTVNNRAIRYSGQPIQIPYTPGQETSVTVKIVDSGYGDNTGSLKAILY